MSPVVMKMPVPTIEPIVIRAPSQAPSPRTRRPEERLEEDVSGEVDDKSVLDAALIAAAQAVEHYEITRYGTLIAWANQLGKDDVARLLEQTLSEEKAADKKLTTLAERDVNQKATVRPMKRAS